MSTEVNTEAVAEVEITAQLTLLVIEKIVAMIQGAMTLVHEGIQLQEKTIMLVVADQPEAVLRQQPILDMQVKNVKRKQVIQLKGIKYNDNSSIELKKKWLKESILKFRRIINLIFTNMMTESAEFVIFIVKKSIEKTIRKAK